MSLKSTFKGFLGETVINVATWLKLDKTIYHRLNNITLPLDNGGSTQIDHVIVSIYGIFVIETKNYKGWIYGKENQRQWTQAFPNGSKYKFQNPLRQNYLHIKTLADLLALDMSYFHSMVVFIGECTLKTRDELPEHVLKGGVISYIKKKQDKVLTEDDVQSIVKQIETKRFSKSWRTNRAHKAYVKDKLNGNNEKLNVKVSVKANDHSDSPKSKTQRVKSKEVPRWSGQVEHDPTPPASIYPKDDVFITPFEEVDSESASELTTNHRKPIKDAATVNEVSTLTHVPTSKILCPKCNSAMIKRIAKKGARQGQHFYGCSQFPKCRSVINVD